MVSKYQKSLLKKKTGPKINGRDSSKTKIGNENAGINPGMIRGISEQAMACREGTRRLNTAWGRPPVLCSSLLSHRGVKTTTGASVLRSGLSERNKCTF